MHKRKYPIYPVLLGVFLLSCTSAPSTSLPSPSATVVSLPSGVPSAENTPIPSGTPSAPATPTPTPMPTPSFSPTPGNLWILDPQGNQIVFALQDRTVSQQSSVQGLYVNEQQDGFIYWVNATNGTLQGKLIKDDAFEPERQFGTVGDFLSLSFSTYLNAQGNGLLLWDRSSADDIGSDNAKSLSSISFQGFQTQKISQNIGAYTLYNLNVDEQGAGWALVSNERDRDSLQPGENPNAGNTLLSRIPVLNWELQPSASQPTVMTLPTFFAGDDVIKGGTIAANGSGLLVLKDPQTHNRVVWVSVQNFQVNSSLTDLPDIPLNTPQAQLKVYLRDGNGYMTWDNINFIPIVNGQPQPQHKTTLPIQAHAIGQHAWVSTSLNALGTGLVAWVEKDSATDLRFIRIQKMENFALVASPYVMKWPHAGSEVQSVHISVNHNGDGYVAGLNNTCELQGNACAGGVRLDRQIWARRIMKYRPL